MTGQRTDLLAALTTIAKELHEQHEYNADELHAAIDDATQTHIPATIFSSELSPLQALARYLQDHPQAHEWLGRPKASIKRALKASKDKHPQPLRPEHTTHTIPATRFADRSLSVLEHVCTYLYEQGLSNKEIAQLIDKDPRTVWTVRNRAAKKRGESDE